MHHFQTQSMINLLVFLRCGLLRAAGVGEDVVASRTWRQVNEIVLCPISPAEDKGSWLKVLEVKQSLPMFCAL
jgi:hypothetical protein